MVSALQYLGAGGGAVAVLLEFVTRHFSLCLIALPGVRLGAVVLK